MRPRSLFGVEYAGKHTNQKGNQKGNAIIGIHLDQTRDVAKLKALKFAHAFTVIACCIDALSAAAQEAPPDQAAELAKKLQNPVASLISFPLQSNFDFRIGPSDEGWRYTLNIQPVIPISIGSDWNLIVRTIIPYIHQEDVFKGPRPNF